MVAGRTKMFLDNTGLCLLTLKFTTLTVKSGDPPGPGKNIKGYTLRQWSLEAHHIGGSKGGGGRQGRAPPPLRPNFFNFMQFLGKIGKNNRLAPPPLQLAHPPLGNPGSATAPGFYFINMKF